MGFDEHGARLVADLVRHHLLLASTATTRDPDDPATVEAIVSTIADPEELALLTALTEADARATAPKAWSSWRSHLVLDLAERARQRLGDGADATEQAHPDVEVPREARGGGLAVSVEPTHDGARVTFVARDRVGLLADLAATFAFQRIPVRACRAWPQVEYAVSVWDVGERHVDAGTLRNRFEAIVDGRLDAPSRLRVEPPVGLAPSVRVRPEVSTRSTVLEVRTTDRPGIVYLVCAALARLDVAVRSAHVGTLGPQAVDVFYLQEAHAGALTDRRAAEAAHAVRDALGAR